LKIEDVPFSNIRWPEMPLSEQSGAVGYALSQTVETGNVRLRLVTFSPGYEADHWCSKGHVVFVLKGQLSTVLQDGRKFLTLQGESFCVGDNDGQHRAETDRGATVFIVD
jgi:quercetin dioxygenase-like cupin family protein